MSLYAVPVCAGYVGSRRKLSVGRRENGGSQRAYLPPFMPREALLEDVWEVAYAEASGRCRDYLFPWVSIFESVSVRSVSIMPPCAFSDCSVLL